MGLTCSLLGHAFEDTDVERDREEQGSEVVTIVREVETCRRCGETRTISENKEVTAIVEPDDVGTDTDGSGALGSMAEAADDPPTDESTTDHPTADHPKVDADDAATDPEFEPPDDPAEEDAEILEDDRETPREPGQWPETEDGFEPTTLTGDRADAAEGAVEDAEDDDAGDDEPDVPEEGEDAESEPVSSPEPAATSVPTGDYVCPECGFSTPAAESSLREGDSCPECRRGYLTGQ